MTALRNGLAALIAVAVLLLLGHALAPVLIADLPSAAGVSAALGLVGCLVTLVYKLLDSALASLGVGRRGAPAMSPWVSALSGASMMGLVSGAFTAVTTALIEQAVPLLAASPGVAATVASPLGHLALWRMGAELFIALMVGAWLGRRHGRRALGLAPVVAILGWAAMLTIDVLAGFRTMPSVHQAFRDLAKAPSLATLETSGVLLLLALLVAVFLGALLGRGGGSRSRDRQPLILGA